MSSQASPKRNMKKYARDASRRKFSLNVDLNDPPVMPEIRQPVGASGATQGRVAVPEIVTSGMAVLPIDVEAIEDDDIQMLSSPRDFNQARNQTRKNRPLVLLDENLELSIGPSAVNVDNHLTRVAPNSFRRRRRFSPNSIIINCDAYVNVEDDDINAKRTKVKSPRAEPEKVMMPKETVFSCPICINSLVDACSTICGHVFCQACIKQAIKAQKKCPTCRRKLTANNFHRVFLPTSS